jgi:ribosomal protein S7
LRSEIFLIYFVAASKKQGSQTDLDECIVTEHWTLNTAGKNWAKPRRYSSTTVSTPVTVSSGRRGKKSLKSQITTTRRNSNRAAKEKFARLLKSW